MTLNEAKQLKIALDNAIAAAQNAGIDHVDLNAQLASFDDQARTDLDNAIKDAERFSQ